MKKFLLAFFAATLLCIGVTASAETVASGTCGANGDNLTWTLDDLGTLTISGEGDMADFGPYNDGASPSLGGEGNGDDTSGDFEWGSASGSFKWGDGLSYFDLVPWYSYGADIKIVRIANGVTSIGSRAFYTCENLTDVYYEGTEEEWAAVTVWRQGNWHFFDATIHFLGEPFNPNNMALGETVKVTEDDKQIFYNKAKLDGEKKYTIILNAKGTDKATGKVYDIDKTVEFNLGRIFSGEMIFKIVVNNVPDGVEITHKK